MQTAPLKEPATSEGGKGRLLESLWNRPRLGLALTAGVAALSGVLTALVMPRGPVTTAQAFVVLGASLALGIVAGLVMRSRWALLVTPLLYAVALESGRFGAVGPTVDLPRFDNAYGILALLLGRGFHALVGLLPMLIGAGFGLMLARYLSGIQVRWTPAVLLLIPVALAVWLVLPARTPPILGPDGEPRPGSVAELTTVRLGRHNQTILIRGASTDNPVLLYLSGGPGQSDLPYTRVLFSDLAQDFVVVSWDQRGTGKSYPALNPATLTLERVVADTLELTDYLRERFNEGKIYLLGESWGSTLGVLAVQERPELYYAFIGSGQMVSQRETDQRLFQEVLDLAERRGDEQLAATMRAYGEPPYEDIPYANAFVMGHYNALYKPYTPPQAYSERGSAAGLGPYGIFGSEYNLIDKVNVLRGLIDMFTLMYPQLQDIDFREDVTELEVPVYILDGAAETSARRDLMLEWFDKLNAPIKRLYTFENAAHSVAFEQFRAFHEIMTDVVVPETLGADAAAATGQ